MSRKMTEAPAPHGDAVEDAPVREAVGVRAEVAERGTPSIETRPLQSHAGKGKTGKTIGVPASRLGFSRLSTGTTDSQDTLAPMRHLQSSDGRVQRATPARLPVKSALWVPVRWWTGGKVALHRTERISQSLRQNVSSCCEWRSTYPKWARPSLLEIRVRLADCAHKIAMEICPTLRADIRIS